MRISSLDKDRTAIPRWRPLQRVPASDLSSIAQQSTRDPQSVRQWADLATQFRAEGSQEAIVDLLDLGISTGHPTWLRESATQILHSRADFKPRVVEAARKALQVGRSHSMSESLIPLETNQPHSIFENIHILKRNLIDNPRNSIIAAELSRSYSMLSEFDKARAAMLRALSISPNNRYILRSATKLFHFLDEEETIVPFLRRSEGFEYDPWIQSAELAVSQAIDLPTRLGKARLRELRNAAGFDRDESELATGLAVLELENGVPRKKVDRLLRMALVSPTENAMAQALWLSKKEALAFESFAQKIYEDPQAWEARSKSFYESKDYVRSEREASLWFADQPLEVRAALSVSYLNMIQLSDYRRARSTAERGVKLHPNEWTIRNCAMLAAGYDGDVNRAKSHLAAMEHLADTTETDIFVSAGRGFVSFCQGDIERGRENYLEAMSKARRGKKFNLILTAAVYWLEREAVAGSTSPAEAEQVIDAIEKGIKKIGSSESSEIQEILDARKPTIDSLVSPKVEQGLFDQPIHRALSDNIA